VDGEFVLVILQYNYQCGSQIEYDRAGMIAKFRFLAIFGPNPGRNEQLFTNPDPGTVLYRKLFECMRS